MPRRGPLGDLVGPGRVAQRTLQGLKHGQDICLLCAHAHIQPDWLLSLQTSKFQRQPPAAAASAAAAWHPPLPRRWWAMPNDLHCVYFDVLSSIRGLSSSPHFTRGPLRVSGPLGTKLCFAAAEAPQADPDVRRAQGGFRRTRTGRGGSVLLDHRLCAPSGPLPGPGCCPAT